MLSSTWRDRLQAEVDKAVDAGRSMRALSREAGMGNGYLHSILKEGKDPGVESLFAVCDALGVSPVYILLGIDAAPEDEDILRALHENPDARMGILAILGARAGRRPGA